MVELDEQTKTFTLEKYIRRAVEYVKHRGRGNEIRVNCPFCGDTNMKGTLWLTNTYRWCYTCWRASCQCSDHGILATKWLKQTSPSMYDEYVEELKSMAHKDKKDLDILKQYIELKKAEDAKRQKEELELAIAKDRKEARFFKRITTPGVNQEAAISYCKKRMIPEEVWSKFLYADEGKYRNRVIIPFYNRDGKIAFFQGRTLEKDNDIKYLSRVGRTALYNYDWLDKSKPVAVLEGPIDSLFLENSTATVGAGSSRDLDELLKDYDCYYIFDNDKAGKKKAYKRVQEGKPVFMWSVFTFTYNLPSDIKDINDVILHLKRKKKFTIKELKDCFTRYVDQYKTIELKSDRIELTKSVELDEIEVEET